MAQLLQPESFKLDVSIMATSKETGSTDCGLYAIAISTSLAFNQNPSILIFNQEDMRSHFIDCLNKQKMMPFPTAKTKRLKKFVNETVTIHLCPVCKKIENENSTLMIGCDKCDNWYHDTCIVTKPDENEWYCFNCTTEAGPSGKQKSLC